MITVMTIYWQSGKYVAIVLSLTSEIRGQCARIALSPPPKRGSMKKKNLIEPNERLKYLTSEIQEANDFLKMILNADFSKASSVERAYTAGVAAIKRLLSIILFLTSEMLNELRRADNDSKNKTSTSTAEKE